MVRELADEGFGPKKMTKKSIVDSCKKNKLYITPHLNDILYLNFSGYNAIESLEEYVGLKCLWLESNAISEIKGLANQTELKCLYLQNNLIMKIENLDSCKKLDTLNLSHNHINKVENCGHEILPVLNTLNLSHNYLKTAESLDQLRHCHFVSVLDISHNRIEDIAIVKILGDMKELRVLTLTGNPVVNEIPSYRKTLILECKNLTYLDTRPVFDRDRACAEAWKRGGFEEERKELLRWKKEEQRKMRRSINATLRMRHRGDGEPELLKTSSDEEDEETSKKNKEGAEMLEVNEKTNEQAWDEVERLFCHASSSTGVASIFQRSALSRGGGTEDDQDGEIDEDAGSAKIEEIFPHERPAFQPKQKLIEEIPSEDEEIVNHNNVTAAEKDDTEINLDVTKSEDKHPLELLKPLMTLIAEDPSMESSSPQRDCGSKQRTLIEEIVHSDPEEDENSYAQNEESKLEPAAENKNMKKVISTEQEDDTLNVMIENNEDISITMESKEGELISKVESRPSSAQGIRFTVVSAEDVGHNSDSEDSTNEDHDTKSSSLSVTSDSDSSDSEDLFDKIVPNKNPKLALTRCSVSTTSTDSEDDEPAATKLLTSSERKEKSIAECLDEYKKFFQAANVLDQKPEASTSRTSVARPQTAKTKRTDPIVYEGVIKTMERNGNAAKIEEARAQMKESKESVIDRLIQQQQDAIDMDLEAQKLSIGGQEYNFNEHRLQVFRQDQEKLQSLIDRVTAQKDRYNAHIDQIHDQLSNIMADYDQIGAKLKKVDDLLQNISENTEADRSQMESSEIEEDIPEELEAEDDPDPTFEAESLAQQIIQKMVAQTEGPKPASDDSSNSSSEDSTDEDMTALIRPDHDLLEILAAPKPIPILEEEMASNIPNDFTQDPVYRKFIDIQQEIDKLTEDELYDIVTEASEELAEETRVEQCLSREVDQYWKQFEDIEDFRKHINLDTHPIVMKFRQFIRCHGDGEEFGEASETVANLDKACRKIERRLSNHLFDEYLVLSRRMSIATTGGESSAAEIELIEVDEGSTDVKIQEEIGKNTAWDESDAQEEATEQDEVKDIVVDGTTQQDVVDGATQDAEDAESKLEDSGNVDLASDKNFLFTQCDENNDL